MASREGSSDEKAGLGAAALMRLAAAAGRGDAPLLDPGADGSAEGLCRRAWLKLVGGGLALAAAGSCARAEPPLMLSYVVTPPDVTPGVRRFYATSMVTDGYATGLLVESHEGRPTKIEGHPDHPASLGATSIVEQASVLDLYDPDRAKSLQRDGHPVAWEAVVAWLTADRPDRGAGLRVLLEPTSSPLTAELIGAVLARSPAARFTFHAPVGGEAAAAGAAAVLGAPALPQRDLREASVVVALDADFLARGPFHLRHARHFAERRRIAAPGDAMNRLYAVEPCPTPTGTMADHRLRLRASETGLFAASLLAEVVLGEGRAPAGMPPALAGALARLRPTPHARLVEALASDLVLARGAHAIFVGDRQPPEVHAVAHALDAALGPGPAGWLSAPVLLAPEGATQGLASLAEELRAGQVDTLVILGGNPSYTAPPDLDLPALLRRVPRSLYLAPYVNETARDCQWIIPAAHYLESWGDARAYDGTRSLVQPLIAPLFGGRTASEVLAMLAGERRPDARALLFRSLRARAPGPDVATFLDTVLRAGIVPDSEAARVTPAIVGDGLERALRAIAEGPAAAPGAIEVAFAEDPATGDGRCANNAWLLELPRPITKLTWDNAALMSEALARRLGVATEDVVTVSVLGRSIEAPVLVTAGHADDAVTLHLGWGREGAESLAAGVGVNAYLLRASEAQAFAGGALVRKVPDRHHPLARTQRHFGQEGRDIAPCTTLARYREDPGLTAHLRGPLPSLLPAWEAPPPQWAMTIDTSICTGCSACVVACQAENNVLVVGKPGVLDGRHMAWLRIDSYEEGADDALAIVHQPMLCQHCENAPCEYVCPVNATVHSPDGLNEMVYNRCVGTRFCSNNCPYKVRRFNWFDWKDEVPRNDGLIRLQRNPEVTVRDRGVMEKCTYCVQRIRNTEITARAEQRDIRPGEVVTACQAACPTGAIQFGSLHHAGTKMVDWRAEPRAYAVLHELGTRPRTQYLARVTNPSPALTGALPPDHPRGRR